MVNYDVQKSGVFPNPFSDELIIHFESDAETTINLFLSDNNGRIVDQLTSTVQIGTQNLSFQIDSELPSGMYFLRIVSQGKATFHKLLKQKLK